jgi:hypothetical protein
MNRELRAKRVVLGYLIIYLGVLSNKNLRQVNFYWHSSERNFATSKIASRVPDAMN